MPVLRQQLHTVLAGVWVLLRRPLQRVHMADGNQFAYRGDHKLEAYTTGALPAFGIEKFQGLLSLSRMAANHLPA